MLFLKNLFGRKTVLSFVEKEEAFASALLKIEEKHHLFFKNGSMVPAGQLYDHLRNYYSLYKEFEYIRFDYRPDAGLPENIRKECDAAYLKIWGNN